MRFHLRLALALAGVGFLAACTTSAGTEDTCTHTLQCTGADCQLSTARADTSLCPAIEQTCGSYTIITVQGTDTSTEMYYDASGELAASIHTGPSGVMTCSGPASFVHTFCQTPTSTLSACSASL